MLIFPLVAVTILSQHFNDMDKLSLKCVNIIKCFLLILKRITYIIQ